MRKKILWGITGLIIIIQFFQPERNTSNTRSPTDLSTVATIPDSVNLILQKACNDCHTNNSKYPWYSNIQPIGWWMAHHIKEGKEELNLSEFGSYSPKFQYRRLNAVIGTVKENEMPLASYTWTHREAILTDAEKLVLIKWAEELRMDIKMKNNLNDEE